MKQEKFIFMESLAAACSCGNHHPITIDTIIVEADAMKQIAPYLLDHGYKKTVIVADDNTYQAAGLTLLRDLSEAGIAHTLCLAQADARGDVVADEATIVGLLLEMPQDADVLLAVGSGTIHDMVRFISFKMGKPFISVPTAPSVDGFTSVGAPLIIKGEKKTIPAIAPNAIFADLNVLTLAPQSLVAAGFGDMLGKYTSLFDWWFGHLTADEAYCQAAAEMTRQALSACVENVQEIAKRSEFGIRLLTNSLIESGLAMQLFGWSHPASGSEHHLSHYWEMEYLRLGRKQMLHGAKVGVACAEITALYRQLNTNWDKQERIKSNWETIREMIQSLPSPERIRGLLREVGGPASPEELGIDPALLQRSLMEAHLVRLNRFTLLRAVNENSLD